MRKLFIGGLVAVLSLTSSQMVFAHSDEDHSDDKRSLLNTVDKTVDKTVRVVEDTTASGKDAETTVKSLADRLKLQREQIESRKTELREELNKKIDDRKEKLEGGRLAQCQNRQNKINLLMDKSVNVGRDRLARIQRIEEGVKSFYESQALSSDEYDSAIQAVDQKEAAAIAAIDVTSTQEFECTDVDGLDPSGIIKSSHQAKKVALDEYRDAVKNLIAVVKSAFAEKKSASEATQ